MTDRSAFPPLGGGGDFDPSSFPPMPGSAPVKSGATGAGFDQGGGGYDASAFPGAGYPGGGQAAPGGQFDAAYPGGQGGFPANGGPADVYPGAPGSYPPAGHGGYPGNGQDGVYPGPGNSGGYPGNGGGYDMAGGYPGNGGGFPGNGQGDGGFPGAQFDGGYPGAVGPGGMPPHAAAMPGAPLASERPIGSVPPAAEPGAMVFVKKYWMPLLAGSLVLPFAAMFLMSMSGSPDSLPAPQPVRQMAQPQAQRPALQQPGSPVIQPLELNAPQAPAAVQPPAQMQQPVQQPSPSPLGGGLGGLGGAPVDGGTPIDAKVLGQVQDRVHILEQAGEETRQQVAQLGAAVERQETLVNGIAEKVAKLEKSGVRQRPAPRPIAHPVKREPHVAAPSPASTPVASTPNWAVRAAVPGTAWVQRGTTGDLRAIRVGEALPGIGAVLDIREQGDRWQVIGESGVISQ